MSESTGKKAERKIFDWLNRPEDGYLMYRIPDQVTGWYGTSQNPCDFFVFKMPHFYAIESKCTEHDRFDFAMLTDYQHECLQKYSKIPGCFGYVIVLFATYKRAFILDIRDIDKSIASGKKSINITKIKSWKIPYREIQTIPSRKALLDYKGDIDQ